MTPQLGGVMLDTPRSVSPALIKAAPMAKTAILPSRVMDVRPQSAIQGANWTQIPGSASSAAAAPDGSLWVLSDAPAGADKYIWHLVSGTWTNISGLASHLAVAPNGTLYAINSGGGTYSYSGGTWTGLGGGASAVATASDGSLFVLSNAGAGPDRAIWHNIAGTWSQVPGSGVSIAGSFDAASYAVAGGTVSPGGLYILNSIGSIYYENADKSFVQLPANASMLAPTTVGGVFALGYPASAGGNSIYYYDLSAQGWGAQSGAGVGITCNAGKLYVIGASGGIYSSPVKAASGTIVEYTLPSTSGDPRGITAGPDGALWFTEDFNGNKIGRVTTSGVFTEYPLPTGGGTPHDITTGSDGALWFTENSGSPTGKIGRVTTSGAFTEYPLPTAGSQPEQITSGPDGALWFTESPGKVGRVTTSGAFTEYVPPSGILGGITAGPDGALWVTPETISAVVRVSTSGVFTTLNRQSGSPPWGITTGPDGALWYTEFLSGYKVGRMTTTGTDTEYSIPTANSGPDGITAGPDGALWFTELYGNKIGRMTTSGAVTEYPLPTAGGGPYSITTGPDGALWFTEESGNKIGRISP